MGKEPRQRSRLLGKEPQEAEPNHKREPKCSLRKERSRNMIMSPFSLSLVEKGLGELGFN